MSDEDRRRYDDRDFNILDVKIDKYFSMLRDEIAKVEARAEEKYRLQREAVTTATEILNARLAEMNEFRRQIDVERTKYITREQLDLIMKALSSDIRPMQDQGHWAKGRNATLLLMASLAGATVSFFISLFSPWRMK